MAIPVRFTGVIDGPGPVDLPILASVGRYAYLTARQVARLHYAPASLSYVQARLKRLADAGYLERCFLPRPTRCGSAPIVYTVSRLGERTLTHWGEPSLPGTRPTNGNGWSYLFLAHTLALNDLLIALERWCRGDPRLELVEWRHERLLRHQPLAVRLADGTAARVIPDAWVDLRIVGRFQVCYLIELDRGTMGQPAWRRKVAALLAAAAGPYQAAFGTTALTILVVATPGEHRRAALVRWTEAELLAQGCRVDADLFRFTAVSFATIESSNVFQAAVWISPFASVAQSLTEISAISDDREVSVISDRSDTAAIADTSDQSMARNKAEEDGS